MGEGKLPEELRELGVEKVEMLRRESRNLVKPSGDRVFLSLVGRPRGLATGK